MKMSKDFIQMFNILLLIIVTCSDAFDLIRDVENIPGEIKDSVYTLRRNGREKMKQCPKKQLQVFCYEGERTRLSRLWVNSMVKIKIMTDDYEVFRGSNISQVYQQYKAAKMSWFNLMPWKTDVLTMPPFNSSCIAIATKEEYTIEFRVKVIDPWLVSYLVLGLILFISAKKLSRNIVFYYGTGISVGLFASLLIIVFILSKMMPGKKPVVYAFMMSGWSLSLYFIQYIWDNIQGILESYSHFVIGYFVLAGLISFVICYWKGPVVEHRSLNLIKWSVQLVGLVLVYNGTQIQELSVCLILLILTIHNFPSFLTAAVKGWWRKRFPPKVKLLSEAEYMSQGDVETRKALAELRDYCKSPQCNAWKTLSRIQTPQRFASFVEGDSHLSDDEILHHDVDDIPPPYYTDDSDSDIEFALHSP